ncbi:MAG: hypothetical protein RIK87_23200 [Fuerstiella sp.]
MTFVIIRADNNLSSKLHIRLRIRQASYLPPVQGILIETQQLSGDRQKKAVVTGFSAGGTLFWPVSE